jgi:hypothetical protein
MHNRPTEEWDRLAIVNQEERDSDGVTQDSQLNVVE